MCVVGAGCALILLPAAGVLAKGISLTPYLEFPPRTFFLQMPAFSWPMFILCLALILALVCPFLLKALRTHARTVAPLNNPSNRRPFPIWGWIALIHLVGWWVIAWTRFPWATSVQPHTYFPLWISYIVIVNAWTYKLTGSCFLTRHTLKLLILFPVSAAFWWFFEYLNRFVQNWNYIGTENYTPLAYFGLATLSFSTVLPAVASTRSLIEALWPGHTCFKNWINIRPQIQKGGAALMVLISVLGLYFLSWFPFSLFSMLWIAPVALFAGVGLLTGARIPLAEDVRRGDWTVIVTSALAALVCGFFWEMWNQWSLAKWVYTVPYVQRFHIFEMPLLGFAGYLPFGVECTLVSDFFMKRNSSTDPRFASREDEGERTVE